MTAEHSPHAFLPNYDLEYVESFQLHIVVWMEIQVKARIVFIEDRRAQRGLQARSQLLIGLMVWQSSWIAPNLRITFTVKFWKFVSVRRASKTLSSAAFLYIQLTSSTTLQHSRKTSEPPKYLMMSAFSDFLRLAHMEMLIFTFWTRAVALRYGSDPEWPSRYPKSTWIVDGNPSLRMKFEVAKTARSFGARSSW